MATEAPVGRVRVLGFALEGLLLGILLWLSVSPAIQMVFGWRVSAVRRLAAGHWELGFMFAGLIVVVYPLHLFLHYPSYPHTIRRLLRQLLRFLSISAAVIFAVKFYAVARFLVPPLALAYTAYHFRRQNYGLSFADAPLLLAVALALAISFTSSQPAREWLFFWFVVPLYWWSNISVDGVNPTRLLSTFLLYATIGAGMLAVTVYGGGGGGKQHLILHGLTAYVFATAALWHACSAFQRLPRSSRWALAISLVSAFTIAAGVDTRRVVGLWKLERFRDTLAISRTPGKVSEYSALQGYATPADVDPNWFVPPTGTCATEECHTSITQQHNLSAHAHAMDSSAFKVELGRFIKERGRLAADHCLGCHAPLGVIAFPASETVQIDPLTTGEPAFLLGVGCVVCHRARFAPPPSGEPKNASIAIRPLWLEDYWPLLQSQTMKEFVRSELETHRQTFRVREWEPICGACHVVSLPGSLAADKHERATIDQYTSFTSSPYARAGKTCSSCHQQRFVNADGYAVFAHSYLGSGASLPYDDAADDKQLRDISIGFLSGLGDIEMDIRSDGLPLCLDDLDRVNSDTSGGRQPLYNHHGIDMNQFTQRERGADNPFNGTNGGLLRRNLLSVDASLVSLDAAKARLGVKTTNACVGHSFPSGEGIKGYLEVFAYDQTGRTVGRYGGLGEDGLPLPLPTTLGVNAIDAAGNVIKDRRYWNAVEIVYRRVLNPGQPSDDTVDVPIEAGAHPTRFEIRWNYLRPEYLRSRERGLTTDLPPVLVGTATVE